MAWCADSSLIAVARSAGHESTDIDADFRAAALPGLTSVSIDAKGSQHIVIKSGRDRITMRIRGALVLASAVRITFEIASLAGLFAAQRNVSKLHEIYVDKPVSPPKWTPTALEKRDALIALDAHFNHSSHREVAVLIFGGDKVNAEWVADGCELKDYVRRCRNRGLRYMQGGYRRLLR